VNSLFYLIVVLWCLVEKCVP